MFCSNCGNQLAGGAYFCTACGKGIEGSPPQQEYAPPKEETAFAYAAPQAAYAPSQGPGKSRKADVALIVTIAGIAVSLLSVGAYFLFFAGGPALKKTQSDPPAIVAAATAAPTARPAAPTPRPTPQSTPEGTLETVANETIKISAAFDSGEGVYTGEVNSEGVPHGQGSFIMQKSDKGFDWSYEGQWENGAMTGEGVKKDGGFVFAGSFRDGLSNGYCEITDDGILRYKGMCKDGMLHGEGALYTKSGRLVFEGAFENDMLAESEADRKRRGEAFTPECEDMDELLYDGCMAEDNTFGYPVAVWGFPLAMGEQRASGTIIIDHFAEDDYPVCLLYRYGVGERKMDWDDWINAWGVVIDTYEYKDGDGRAAVCPLVEVIYWNNEQEGL